MFPLQLFSIWIAASACLRHTGEILALKGPGTGLEPDWKMGFVIGVWRPFGDCFHGDRCLIPGSQLPLKGEALCGFVPNGSQKRRVSSSGPL